MSGHERHGQSCRLSTGDAPVFDLDTAHEAGDPGVLRDVQGRPWTRVVFGDDGVVAAEDPAGALTTWGADAARQLFEAVFRRRDEP